MKYISGPAVCQQLGICRTTLHRIIKADPTFPKAIRFGSSNGKRFFLNSEFQQWQENRADHPTQ